MKCNMYEEEAQPEKKFRCFSCKSDFYSLEELCRHIGFKCQTFSDKCAKAKAAHLQPYQCRKCFQIFISNAFYDKHWSVQHSEIPKLFMYENPHPCVRCGLIFRTSRALQTHQVWQKCTTKSSGLISLSANMKESEMIDITHVNAHNNQEGNLLINLSAPEMKESIATRNNFAVGRYDSQSNVFVPLYFSDYTDRFSKVKDTQMNKSQNSANHEAGISLIFAKCNDVHLREKSDAFCTTEKTLFESLGIGSLPDQSVNASEIFNDKSVENFHERVCEINQSKATTAPANCSPTSDYVEKLFRNTPSSQVEKIEKMHPYARVATKNFTVRKGQNKYATECRICHASIAANQYRKHFLAAHTDYALDDMFDDGWKCGMCSSMHSGIDKLRLHWKKEHSELYDTKQFTEFKKLNTAFLGASSL